MSEITSNTKCMTQPDRGASGAGMSTLARTFYGNDPTRATRRKTVRVLIGGRETRVARTVPAGRN